MGLFLFGKYVYLYHPLDATCCLVAKLCPTLCNSTDCSKAPLSLGFPKQEYLSGLPFPSPGDFPKPGVKSMSPALRADSFTTEPSVKP